MTNPRVFFAESDDRYDTSTAEEFGDVVTLRNTASANPFQTQKCMRELRDALLANRYDPMSDFIAMTGGANIIPLLIAVVVVEYRHVKILMFDGKRNRYFERQLIH